MNKVFVEYIIMLIYYFKQGVGGESAHVEHRSAFPKRGSGLHDF
jgi:hypothetical protein